MNDITPNPEDSADQAAADPAAEESAGQPAVEDAATTEDTSASDFAASAEAPEMGFFAEFWDFLVHNKAWWLTPIILVLVLVFVLVWFAGTPFAPFIYGA
ncbi:MAG TPA: hypothetical protein DCE47_01210 [Planctomycetaceae bacterium]|nr:hypothetical protein [Planctomycetaceae bacterium]